MYFINCSCIKGCDDEETRKAAFTRLKQDAEFHQFLGKLQSFISSPMVTILYFFVHNNR